MKLHHISPLIMLLIGCPSPPVVGDSGSDTDGSDSEDSSDTGPVIEPVWQDLSLETSATFTAAYASGNGLYATTEDGDVWLRQNSQWIPIPIEVDEEAINGLWGTGQGAAMDMVSVGDAGFVSQWVEGAWVTEDLGTPNFEAVDGPRADDLLAVGWGGVYRRSADGWDYEAVDGNPRLNHIWYNGSLGIAVGEEGTIATVTPTGWTVTQEGSRIRLYGVTAMPNGEIIAVGEEGAVLHNIGGFWEQRDAGTNVSLWAVEAFDNYNVIAVGNNGVALHYDGTEWTPLPTGVDNNLYAISISSTAVAWAVGNRGATLGLQL